MSDYLPWQLMQPIATTALLMEFLRWMAVCLLGVGAVALVLYLAGAILLALGERQFRPLAHPQCDAKRSRDLPTGVACIHRVAVVVIAVIWADFATLLSLPQISEVQNVINPLK